MTRFISARYLIKTAYTKRMLWNSVTIFCGLMLISAACFNKQHKFSFGLSLIASVILGSCCALGESAMLAYCKELPNTYVGYFSSGTGFAGIFGASILLLLKSLGLNEA